MNNQTQTQTLPADKIIRALWYAWQLPELDRHQLTLSRCDDPTVAEAYAAIQAGKEGIARAYLQNGAACQLLAFAFNFAPSEGMLNLLRTRRKESGEQLASALFAGLGEEIILCADGGAGSFPTPPERTNKKAAPSGTVDTYKPTPTGLVAKRATRFSRAWEVCEREYYFRVKREVSKAHAEMGRDVAMVYHLFTDDFSAVRFINARQKTIKRARKDGRDPKPFIYQLYPYISPDADAELVAIVSNATETNGARPVPADRTQAYNLFHDWLNTPPETTLNRHSQGYGQQWQGMKGDGRRRLIEKQTGQKMPRNMQFITPRLPEEVKNKLGDNGFIPFAEIDTYAEKIEAMGKWQVRGGGTIAGAFHLLKQACTLLGETTGPEKQSPQVGYSTIIGPAEKLAEPQPIGTLQADFRGSL